MLGNSIFTLQQRRNQRPGFTGALSFGPKKHSLN